MNETRELISVLTGTLRIRHEPDAISIVNIIGAFEDGTEKRFPPHGRPAKIMIGLGAPTRKPGVKPWPAAEQFMVEYVIRSGDPLIKDVLCNMSSPTDFFNLFKILEVICWALGTGNKKKGYPLVWKRGWVAKGKLKDFSDTANKTQRHWDEQRPAPKLDLQEARIMFRRIIEEWIAERARLQLPR